MATFNTITYCSECTKHHGTFDVLSQEELSRLNSSKYEVHFKAGETIFKQGSALTHIACINRGLAKILIEGPHQKNLVIKLLKCPDIVIGPGLYLDQRHHYSLIAVTDVSACLMETKVLQEIIDKNNQFSKKLLQDSTLKRIHNYDQLINLTQKNMSARIADTFLYLSGEVYKSLEFTMDISRQDLADMSAMTKESAIRIIKNLKESNVIELEGNDLKILDKNGLIKISQVG
ncbi:MAG: hypothetical protein CL663_01060 [Bacteroidetes bacterium]|nr:hypothetical protein [Bacteroidota bacterium]|tara:strand:- start:48 stop:743 length:696 start_codon:yes stop_codon:yes gene_type:complete